jgi:hypothetical protein
VVRPVLCISQQQRGVVVNNDTRQYVRARHVHCSTVWLLVMVMVLVLAVVVSGGR